MKYIVASNFFFFLHCIVTCPAVSELDKLLDECFKDQFNCAFSTCSSDCGLKHRFSHGFQFSPIS